MPFIPLNERILIRVNKAEKTASGVVLAETVEKPVRFGEVVEVCEMENQKITKGDIVLFAAFATVPVIVDDEELLIVKFEDILGIQK